MYNFCKYLLIDFYLNIVFKLLKLKFIGYFFLVNFVLKMWKFLRNNKIMYDLCFLIICFLLNII